MKVQFKVSFNFTEIADGDITKLETLSEEEKWLLTYPFARANVPGFISRAL